MNRQGHALLIAVILLLVFGSLSAIVLAGGRLRLVGGRTEVARHQAELLAQGQVDWLVDHWNPLLAESLPIGAQVGVVGPLPPAGMVVADTLYRLGQGLFHIGSTVEHRTTSGGVTGRARTGQLVARTAPTIRSDAAIVAQAGVLVQPGAVVDGVDQPVTAWGALCPAALPTAAGLLLGPSALLEPASCTGAPCLAGVPPVAADTTVVPGWLQHLGAVPLDSLIAHADQSLRGLVVGAAPAVLASGSCDLVAPGNLGDPSSPGGACANYLPISVMAPGAELHDGAGQGVLIGLGALTLSGSFQYAGAVVALGPLVLEDSARVQGWVGAADSLSLLDSAEVRRSTCAVGRAAASSARPFFPVPRRWFEGP